MEKWTTSFDPKIATPCYPAELGLMSHIASMTGVKRIVELGPMLGASTAAIAEGCGENAEIQSYDRFTYQKWMDSVFPFTCLPGTSFELLTRYNLRQYANVELHQVDLTNHRFDIIGGINFLVFDAVKTIDIATNVLPQLLSRLTKGGYLFDQDIGFNPVHMSYMVVAYYTLRVYLKPVLLPWKGTGVLFEVVDPIPEGLIRSVLTTRNFNVGAPTLRDALQYMMDLDVYHPERVK